MLISEVVASKVKQIQPELDTTVKRARAASQHAKAKAARQALITTYAEQTYNALLDQVITSCAREAYFANQFRRLRLRHTLRHWRDWAVAQREDREAAILEREQAYKSLGSMGLSTSTFAWSDSTSTIQANMERLDPFAADVMLHQTERTKEHFYSPSTFLAETARRLAPLVQATTLDNSSFSPMFHTLISPSKSAATPSSKEAFTWLRSKFFSTSEIVQDGVAFEAEVLEMGRRSQSTSVGLMVLEAPLQTWSSEQTRK
jgi:hypothetical protein